MKKIIIKTSLLLLPFLIIYPLLEARLSSIPNMYSKKKEFLESQQNQVEVLTTGSSHGDAINPDYIQVKILYPQPGRPGPVLRHPSGDPLPGPSAEIEAGDHPHLLLLAGIPDGPHQNLDAGALIISTPGAFRRSIGTPG